LTDVGGLEVHLAEGMGTGHGHGVLKPWSSAPGSIEQGQLVQLVGQVVFWSRSRRRRMTQGVAKVVVLLLVLQLLLMMVMTTGQLGLQSVLLLEELALVFFFVLLVANYCTNT